MTNEEYLSKFDSVFSAELRRHCECDTWCELYVKDILSYICDDEATIENTVNSLTGQEKVALLTVDRWPEYVIKCVVDNSQDGFEKIISKNLKKALKEIAEEGVRNTFIEDESE